MNLSADHHFSIGSQHLRQGKPCQDYALSGIFENVSFAIVSDGCSNGENTDVGSRFTALSTAAAIKNHWAINRSVINENDPKEIAVKQSIIQRGAYHMLGLTREDMLATCLYACMSGEGGFMHVLGDGVIAWKLKNGAIVMRKLDWARNAPLYPVYGEDNFSSFTAFHSADEKTPALTAEEWKYEPNDGYFYTKKSEFTVAEGIKGHIEIFSKARIREEAIEYVALFSDGISQVENTNWKDVVVELFAFKSMTGSFAKRRVISFLKHAAETNKKPVDDLACAVIHINSAGEE